MSEPMSATTPDSAVLPHPELTMQTALAGWGARTRTWEWRNQNPQEAFDMLHKRPLICKGFPVSCCICVALGKECATCLPQSSV